MLLKKSEGLVIESDFYLRHVLTKLICSAGVQVKAVSLI